MALWGIILDVSRCMSPHGGEVVSFFNGSVILSLLFGHLYRSLPGRNGLMKGIVFGDVGWLLMNLLFSQ